MIAVLALLSVSCRSQQSAANLYDMDGVSAVYLDEGLMNVGPLSGVGKLIGSGGKSKITSAEVITSSKRSAIKKAMPLVMDKIEAMKAQPLALFTRPGGEKVQIYGKPSADNPSKYSQLVVLTSTKDNLNFVTLNGSIDRGEIGNIE